MVLLIPVWEDFLVCHPTDRLSMRQVHIHPFPTIRKRQVKTDRVIAYSTATELEIFARFFSHLFEKKNEFIS